MILQIFVSIYQTVSVIRPMRFDDLIAASFDIMRVHNFRNFIS